VDDFAEHAFRRHYSDIYRFVRRRTSTDQDAEDLAQEVFADAAASLRYDGRPPLAWLYAVAKRRFADHARRSTRTWPPTVAAARETLDAADRSQEYGPQVGASLTAAFNRLPASQREVVVLKLLRGASFAEIASAVDASEEAVRMRFSRALRSIKGDLEKEGIK
jgi:RNA polymerase sigma-70 factor (ECF subfamily)